MVVKVFPQHDFEVSSIGFVLSFWVLLEHFKMYITITDTVEEKRIDLAYPIQGKVAAIVSMFSNNIQYQIWEPLKVLLIMNKEKQLLERVFMDRELNVSIGKTLITTPMDANDNIIKMDKSWHASQRRFFTWTTSTTLTIQKMEDLAMSYLGIM